MKTKLTVSKDGINEEVFENVEGFKNEEEIENYAKSAVSNIAEIMLTMRIKVPKKPLVIILENYGQYCDPRWEKDIINLNDDMLKNKNSYLIDDIIVLLRGAKNKLDKKHFNDYNVLKSIVLENCQMEDPNVI